MPSPLRSGTDCAAWRELETLAQALTATSTRELFAQDAQRFEHCCVEVELQHVADLLVKVGLAEDLAALGDREPTFRCLMA